MTALLPPNLLRLFAPRPAPIYLKPLVKDDADRGPAKMAGISDIVKRLRDEAEENEYKAGMEDKPTEEEGKPKDEDGVKEEGNGDASMDVDVKAEEKEKPKKKKRDPIAEAGVIGQEAVKMRREARKKRQEAYKKDLEENCESPSCEAS